jgi:phenylalanine-4-hydroxylase
MKFLPDHLKKFIVDQTDKKYTPRDQAVWRYILRQLKTFLIKHAHPFYAEGLQKTGITIESIPDISFVSDKLSQFGWRAAAVSGFIPPAAFMELQSLSVLPIASDMRSIEQLLYTPAPDIVHEAAGHAPMLAHPEFAAYLKEYAQVAKYAIASKEDLEIYDAIRFLSDVKADPRMKEVDEKTAEEKLSLAVRNVSHVSEATQLSRMNWWTAEYGLVGTLNDPKIYGAGLLSSVGEARHCLSDEVKKLPLTIDCINYTYDITEQQPQLFVTPDFKNLSKVLEELSSTMAYKIGGKSGLEKAILAKTVNTVELNSGIQVSGQVIEFLTDTSGHLAYFKMQGPCQISFSRKELEGHSKKYHEQGYGSPLGNFKAFPNKCPSLLTEMEWEKAGLQSKKGSLVKLEYSSGVVVTGKFLSSVSEEGRRVLLSLENATAQFDNKILFDPSWGTYDIVMGEKVSSVFGGPADRLGYGDMEDFAVARVPEAQYSEEDYQAFAYYQIIRDVREGKKTLYDLDSCLQDVIKNIPREWLLVLETYEIALLSKQSNLVEICRNHLEKKIFSPEAEQCILEGLAIVNEKSL